MRELMSEIKSQNEEMKNQNEEMKNQIEESKRETNAQFAEIKSMIQQ